MLATAATQALAALTFLTSKRFLSPSAPALALGALVFAGGTSAISTSAMVVAWGESSGWVCLRKWATSTTTTEVREAGRRQSGGAVCGRGAAHSVGFVTVPARLAQAPARAAVPGSSHAKPGACATLGKWAGEGGGVIWTHTPHTLSHAHIDTGISNTLPPLLLLRRLARSYRGTPRPPPAARRPPPAAARSAPAIVGARHPQPVSGPCPCFQARRGFICQPPLHPFLLHHAAHLAAHLFLRPAPLLLHLPWT